MPSGAGPRLPPSTPATYWSIKADLPEPRGPARPMAPLPWVRETAARNRFVDSVFTVNETS